MQSPVRGPAFRIIRFLFVFLTFSFLTFSAIELVLRFLISTNNLDLTPRFKIRNTRFELIYDPELGWQNPPGQLAKIDKDVEVSINSMGFRDREYAVTKPSDHFRILVLGDSYTWGWGVSQDQIYTEVLEKKLNISEEQTTIVEVINAGVTGYSTDQEYLLLNRIGPVLKPDLILLFYYHNDCFGNVESFFYNTPKPVFSLKSGKLELKNVPCPRKIADEGKYQWLPKEKFSPSVLYQFIISRTQSNYYISRFLDLTNLIQLSPEKPFKTATDCRPTTLELIEKIRTLSKQLNAELLVTHCTDYYDFFNLHSKSDNIDDWLGIELENRKFHHIDLYQAFRNKKVPVEKIMQENWTAHFLPKGHEYIAEVLYEEIQSPKWRLPE